MRLRNINTDTLINPVGKLFDLGSLGQNSGSDPTKTVHDERLSTILECTVKAPY